MSTDDAKISFVELAALVLKQHGKALSAPEIWAAATATGLTSRLDSAGKTPDRSLGAILYTDVKKESSRFISIGARPARFLLREQASQLSEQQLTRQAAEPVDTAKTDPRLLERDIHPWLVWFADLRFVAHTKTIKHEKSEKRGDKHNQWIHPDMVAFSLPARGWRREVFDLSRASTAQTSTLYSFELKRQIGFANLREYFFQAVSNSSWAHEGYLAACVIDEDEEFREELRRLSQSFGIGVIHIDLDSPLDSEVILPAARKPQLDWDTIERIAAINSDFRQFLAAVVSSMQVNQPVLAGADFDPVLTPNQLQELLKSKAKTSVAQQHARADV